MSRYLPIYSTNDWGTDTWWIGPAHDANGHPWNCSHLDPTAKKLPPDGFIDAVFPDGTERRVRIQTEGRTINVYDMGHNYPTKTTTPYVYLDVMGAQVKVPMDALRVDPASLQPRG